MTGPHEKWGGAEESERRRGGRSVLNKKKKISFHAIHVTTSAFMIDFIAYSLYLSIVRLRIHAMPLMIFNDEPALVYLRSAFPSSTTTAAYIIIHIGQEMEADFFVPVSTKESSQLNRVYLSIIRVTFFSVTKVNKTLALYWSRWSETKPKLNRVCSCPLALSFLKLL